MADNSTSPRRWRGDNERPLLNGGASDIAPRVTLGDSVARRMRQAILDGEVVPGQHLREEEISESMGVSRGPVRDALAALQREGLVRLSRHRGASVVELTATDLGEVYSLRSAIEELAVRLAVRRHGEDDIVAIESVVGRMASAMQRSDVSEQEVARLDVEFHDAIFAAAHHERLYASWSGIRMQVYWLLLKRNIANTDWRQRTVNGHRDLLQLLIARDEAGLVAATKQHLRGAYRRILGDYGVSDDVGDVFDLP